MTLQVQGNISARGADLDGRTDLTRSDRLSGLIGPHASLVVQVLAGNGAAGGRVPPLSDVDSGDADAFGQNATLWVLDPNDVNVGIWGLNATGRDNVAAAVAAKQRSVYGYYRRLYNRIPTDGKLLARMEKTPYTAGGTFGPGFQEALQQYYPATYAQMREALGFAVVPQSTSADPNAPKSDPYRVGGADAKPTGFKPCIELTISSETRGRIWLATTAKESADRSGPHPGIAYAGKCWPSDWPDMPGGIRALTADVLDDPETIRPARKEVEALYIMARKGDQSAVMALRILGLQPPSTGLGGLGGILGL